jgi:hypothetical protein
MLLNLQTDADGDYTPKEPPMILFLGEASEKIFERRTRAFSFSEVQCVAAHWPKRSIKPRIEIWETEARMARPAWL